MTQLSDDLRGQQSRLNAEIAKIVNVGAADATPDQKAARRRALELLQAERAEVEELRRQAAIAALTAAAAQVIRAAAAASARRVENVLRGLVDALAETVVPPPEPPVREVEPEPAEAGAPLDEPAPPVVPEPELDDPVIMRRTRTGQVVFGHLVRAVQLGLLGDGRDPLGVDMYFGPDTASALERWHQRTGGRDAASVSVQEWRLLTGLPTPDMFDLCAQITAAFEGHGFGKAVGDFDGAVATWGYHGYTLKFGHLQAVLKRTEAASPGVLAEAFGAAEGAALRAMLDMNLADQVAWGRANLLQQDRRMLPSWIKGFDEIGGREPCRAAQLAHSREAFWERIALPQIRRLGLKEPLSCGLLFDTAIQQGGLGRAAMASLEAAFAAAPAMTEQDKRAAVAKAAVESVGNARFREDVRQRRETFVSGTGRVHDKTYNLSFWGFSALVDEKEGALDTDHAAAAAVVVPPAGAAAARFTAFFDAHAKPLAPNFSADEFMVLGPSNVAGACAGKNDLAPEDFWPNCVPLAAALQRFRMLVGAPVKITNAYRSPAYNACVGGASMSQHKLFKAADIRVEGSGSPTAWRDVFLRLRREGGFRGGLGTYRTFLHVDIRDDDADWTG